MKKKKNPEESHLIGELVSYYKEPIPYPKPMFYTPHCPWGNNFSIGDDILPPDIQFMGTNNLPAIKPRQARRRVSTNNNSLMDWSRQEYLRNERWRRALMQRHIRSRSRMRSRSRSRSWMRSRSRNRWIH